jgi:hypothetical protein
MRKEVDVRRRRVAGTCLRVAGIDFLGQRGEEEGRRANEVAIMESAASRMYI